MKKHLMKTAIGSAVGVLGMAGVAAASNVAVGVDVTTPNARVQVATPAPPPRVTVVEQERVIVREKDHHDRGKHKGHYKKHNKHKKHHH